MIRNLEFEQDLASDIVDIEETVNLMTNALDMYCDRLISGTRRRILAPETVDMEIEDVITTTMLENNPHLKDKFQVLITRDEGAIYSVSIQINKTAVQQHLEQVSGSMLSH